MISICANFIVLGVVMMMVMKTNLTYPIILRCFIHIQDNSNTEDSSMEASSHGNSAFPDPAASGDNNSNDDDNDADDDDDDPVSLDNTVVMLGLCEAICILWTLNREKLKKVATPVS